MPPAGWERLAVPGLALVLALAGCGGGASAGALPDEHAGIEGTVTSVRPFDPRDQPPTDRVGVLRVEEYPDRQVGDPGLPTGGDKATVTVTTDTRILGQKAGALQRAAFDDLATGQQIAVWFSGPVAESYPVQATAATIVFRPSG